LSGLILFIAIFLVCFVSDDAFKFASVSLPPEIVSRANIPAMLAIIAPLYYLLNLVILAAFKKKRRTKQHG
jgi:hypothetical protein